MIPLATDLRLQLLKVLAIIHLFIASSPFLMISPFGILLRHTSDFLLSFIFFNFPLSVLHFDNVVISWVPPSGLLIHFSSVSYQMLNPSTDF